MPLRFLPHEAKRTRVPKNKTKGRGGYVVGTFQPPGGPLKQVLVPLSVGRGLFFIGDLSMSSTNRQKKLSKVGGG